MSNNGSLAVDSDNYIRVSLIREASTDTIPTSISVKARIYNAAGDTPVSDEITLTQVTGNTDQYEGTFPDTVTLVNDTEYKIKETTVANSLTRIKWKTVKAWNC